MSRRFQFSLSRLIVAMTLICAAAAFFQIGANGPRLENAIAWHLLTFVLAGCGVAVLAGLRRRGMLLAVLAGAFADIVWGCLLAVWR